MKIKKINSDVYYTESHIVTVGKKDIDFLKNNINQSDRKRIRLCSHSDVKDKLHEMFIMVDKETYIRPHKHINKVESLCVIEGEVDVVFFDDSGNVIDVVVLGDYLTSRIFYCRINEPIYHTLLVRSDFLVFLETTIGPFDKADTIFASWAVDENDRIAAKNFKKALSMMIKEMR